MLQLAWISSQKNGNSLECLEMEVLLSWLLQAISFFFMMNYLFAKPEAARSPFSYGNGG